MKDRLLEIKAAAQRKKGSPPEYIIKSFMIRRGFRWQHVLAPFIVDFYHPRLNIVIEIDGRHHAKQQEQDEQRNRILIEKYGVKIVRLRAQDCFDGFYWRKIEMLLKIGAFAPPDCCPALLGFKKEIKSGTP